MRITVLRLREYKQSAREDDTEKPEKAKLLFPVHSILL